MEERNLLLHDGIATYMVQAGDIVAIEREVTMYQTNKWVKQTRRISTSPRRPRSAISATPQKPALPRNTRGTNWRTTARAIPPVRPSSRPRYPWGTSGSVPGTGIRRNCGELRRLQGGSHCRAQQLRPQPRRRAGPPDIVNQFRIFAMKTMLYCRGLS